MANLPTAAEFVGNTVNHVQFKAALKLLVENVLSADTFQAAFTYVDSTQFTQGIYVRPSGEEATSNTLAATGYIPVVEGQAYSIYSMFISTAPLVWFDKNKVMLSSEYAQQTTLSEKVYVAPAGAVFVRVNFYGTASASKPYLKSVMYDVLKLNKWFETHQLQVLKANYEAYANQFTTYVDASKFTQGTYVGADGLERQNVSFASTGYIPVVAGQKYTAYTRLSSNTPILWFDKNKVLISFEYANQTTLSEYEYTAPAQAAFMRINLSGIAATVKPYVKSKVYILSILDAWFNQYQVPVVSSMIQDAIQGQTSGGSSTPSVSNSVVDALILQGQAPYWVKRAQDGSAAILDFDCDKNKFFYRGTEYSTLVDAINAVGGLSKVIDEATKAFVLNGNYNENALNSVKEADASSKDFDGSKFVTVNTTVSKNNNALVLTQTSGTTGSSATLEFKVKANTTYLIKSANSTGKQGVRLSIQNGSGASILPIGAWNSATEELREFISGAVDDTYKLKIELPGNGATSYLSYCKIYESVAFAGLNRDGFTLVADFTPSEMTASYETYLQVGQTGSRANYTNHIAVVRGQNGHTYPIASNMLKRDGAYGAYIPASDTGDNIAQIGEKSTLVMSVGGGFVALSSGFRTKLQKVNHDLVSLMNSAMISVGCSGTGGGQKATALLNRFTVFSKAFKDPAHSVEFFTSQQSKFLLLGDSFATLELAKLIQTETGIKTLRDGAGGTSLRQQANRLEAEPKLWDCQLIIMDGGFEFKEKYGQGYLDAIERVITCLEAAGHSRYYYVQPSPGGYDDYSIGTARRASWDEGQAEIKKLIGASRYIPTLSQMQAYGSGSQSDNALIAKGLMPANLRADDIHENTLGLSYRAQIISNWISSNPLE
ncbi:hypothetical protein [Acinetobacter terrae]|uniref:SGNH/GDSL hydrolase family protein n=1 Tax=Acinetobacter terrae TaxID=2731247 RepID=A0ABX1V6J8_9GAMM|nr:hypothetical protein [Acinetobacter terrae]NNH88177.1 hypothetical protein [Acinetobacter terrae]